MFSVTIWNKDVGFCSDILTDGILKLNLFFSSSNIQALKKAQDALKEIDSHTDLLEKSLKGASGFLEQIYLGKDNRSDEHQRIAQCFRDKRSQNLNIFLDPNKITTYSPVTVLYLMAHELEHACQYQKNPIAHIDDKTKPEEKHNITDNQKISDMIRDCVIETDAIAVGLGAVISCGGTREEYMQLKKELPMLADAFPEYDKIKRKKFKDIVNLATQKILPWRWGITRDYLEKNNLKMPSPQTMRPLLETNMVRACAVFEAFISAKTKGEGRIPSPFSGVNR